MEASIDMTQPAPRKTLLAAAHGRTGRAILQALVARQVPVRALVRRDTQSAPLLALGAVECPHIAVYVDRLTDKLRAQIAAEWDGVPVKIEVTDTFEAQ